ncbi:MAG: D-alanine--D-alanine ligase [Gemmataceae bacterium]|nr:D-alanine--D-alanine ligase [Gemmataceae bacterium]
MANPTVLVLYNQPLLAKDHPDAQSEHSVVEIAGEMAGILSEYGFRVTQFGLGFDPALLGHELKKRKPDAVFNLFEGSLDQPETESFVAGLLEWAGVPYTGSPPQTLSLARGKHTVKHLLKGARLPTADFVVVDKLPVPKCVLEFPVIVKPATLDGSVGLDQKSVCVNQRQVKERVQYLLTTYGPPVIVEEYLDGRELNVALVELPHLQALPPLEISFPGARHGAWSILTYDGKWKPGSHAYESTPVKYPADLPRATTRRLEELALKAYRLVGCRDYARVDFRLNAAGRPHILEVNPNPEISENTGFSSCLGSADISYKQFIVRLVEQALTRRNAPKPTFDSSAR